MRSLLYNVPIKHYAVHTTKSGLVNLLEEIMLISLKKANFIRRKSTLMSAKAWNIMFVDNKEEKKGALFIMFLSDIGKQKLPKT